MVLGGVAVIGLCLAGRYYWGDETASAEAPSATGYRTATSRATQGATPSTAARPTSTTTPSSRLAAGVASATPTGTELVGRVNDQTIHRDELATECIRLYGTEVLESLVNKFLISQECDRRRIKVSQEEIDTEIERMAARFNISVDQWLKMLAKERGIKPEQYSDDIMWPTLALRKLAGDRLTVSREDLTEAFESRFGPAVKVRILVHSDPKEAARLRARAVADPASFATLAKDFSEDVASASANGMIRPIHQHTSDKAIEQVVFSMKEGEISQVLPLGNQHVIFKCEGQIPARNISFEQAAPQLEVMIRDQKLRGVAGEVFKELQERSQVQNVLNDPVLSRQVPGVAAIVNGRQVPIRHLKEECLRRHGEEMLDGLIDRRLLEQECKRRGITISDADIDAGVVEAAAFWLPHKADGSPDIEGWLKRVTEESAISVQAYRSDVVWAKMALKKMVVDSVKVLPEDVDKGFEANFGPRVRCRAIVLSDLRHAQQVFAMLRTDPSVENFAKLAEQFSVEAGSKSLGGQVPPIRKNGGRPLIEDKAFALKPGELSSIIQVDQNFVILLCEGMTEPVAVEKSDVLDEIQRDLFDKKLRLAMNGQFRHLKQSARIDNYLTGTMQAPKRVSQAGTTTGSPLVRPVPVLR